MVIISTSAIEVSIQAVSPEFGVHFSKTGGLAVPSQAGGAGSAAGGRARGGGGGWVRWQAGGAGSAAAAAAGAAGAGAGACACADEAFTNTKLRNAARRSPQARASS